LAGWPEGSVKVGDLSAISDAIEAYETVPWPICHGAGNHAEKAGFHVARAM